MDTLFSSISWSHQKKNLNIKQTEGPETLTNGIQMGGQVGNLFPNNGIIQTNILAKWNNISPT